MAAVSNRHANEEGWAFRKRRHVPGAEDAQFGLNAKDKGIDLVAKVSGTSERRFTHPAILAMTKRWKTGSSKSKK